MYGEKSLTNNYTDTTRRSDFFSILWSDKFCDSEFLSYSQALPQIKDLNLLAIQKQVNKN